MPISAGRLRAASLHRHMPASPPGHIHVPSEEQFFCFLNKLLMWGAWAMASLPTAPHLLLPQRARTRCLTDQHRREFCTKRKPAAPCRPVCCPLSAGVGRGRVGGPWSYPRVIPVQAEPGGKHSPLALKLAWGLSSWSSRNEPASSAPPRAALQMLLAFSKDTH